jgi:2,6-dihydroxypseudooxynicotine hydrolase
MTTEPILEIFNDQSKQGFLYRLCNGLDLRIVQDALNAVGRRRQWYAVWMEVGDMYRELGEAALLDRHPDSAAELLIKAALGYHFAQFLHYGNQAEKDRGLKAKIDAFTRVHSLIRPPINAFDVKFEGARLPVHVRVPSRSGPHPAVVIICGMDSSKEEYFGLQSYLLDRGLAVVGFDGPGQGEVWSSMKMRPDFHKAVSAVTDAICNLPEIDSERIGLVGQSFGALIGPMVMAHDRRFKVGVVNGGFFDLTLFDWANPIRKIGLPYILGASTEEDAKKLAKEFTLADCIGRVRAPLMVIHGELDRDCPTHHARRMVDEVGGPGKFMSFPDGIHMCHNVAHKVRPMLADWLVDNLVDRRS